MVRRLSIGKNSHLTCYSLALNPRILFFSLLHVNGCQAYSSESHFVVEDNIYLSWCPIYINLESYFQIIQLQVNPSKQKSILSPMWPAQTKINMCICVVCSGFTLFANGTSQSHTLCEQTIWTSMMDRCAGWSGSMLAGYRYVMSFFIWSISSLHYWWKWKYSHSSISNKSRMSQSMTKTYNKTCVTSKDSDQPVHPTSMARLFVSPSLDSLEDVEGICDQLRLIRLHRCAGWSESSLVTQVFL